jgi:hypothetical protein
MTLVVRKRLAGRQLTRDSLTQIVAVQLSSLGGGDWKSIKRLGPTAMSDQLTSRFGRSDAAPHAWIATRRGFTPMMFMTRVRL